MIQTPLAGGKTESECIWDVGDNPSLHRKTVNAHNQGKVIVWPLLAHFLPSFPLETPGMLALTMINPSCKNPKLSLTE